MDATDNNNKIMVIRKQKSFEETLSVKARPSRPSGKRTVNSFLSVLTTTLQKVVRSYMMLAKPNQMY